MVRIASYNVENLFARPKVFRTNDWSISEPILAAYEEVNALFQANSYSDQDKANIKRLLVDLDVYVVQRQRSRASQGRHRAGRGCARTAVASTDSPKTPPRTSRSSPLGEQVGSAGSSWPRKPSTRPAPG